MLGWSNCCHVRSLVAASDRDPLHRHNRDPIVIADTLVISVGSPVNQAFGLETTFAFWLSINFTPRGRRFEKLEAELFFQILNLARQRRVVQRATGATRARNAAPPRPPRNSADAAVPFRYFIEIGTIVKIAWTYWRLHCTLVPRSWTAATVSQTAGLPRKSSQPRTGLPGGQHEGADS